MEREKAFLKKVLAVTLSLAMAFVSSGIFSACKQKENSNTNTEQSGDSGVNNPETSDQETKIAVATVVNEHFSNINFENDFNLALIDLVAKKANIEDVKDIDVLSFEKAKSGKLVLFVTYEEGAEKESDEITYSGDTTKFETFYNMSINSSAVISSVIADNGLTLDGDIVEDSSIHTALEEDFTSLLKKYNQEKTVFEEITAESLTIKEDKPIEYVTVQSIVDDVFSGMDFDENIKDSAQALITTTSNSNRKLNKLYAMDYVSGTNGTVSFYLEHLNAAANAITVRKYDATLDTTKISNYLNLSKDFEGAIADILTGYSLALDSKIDKESSLKTEVLEALTLLKNNYLTEKATFDSTASSSIARTTLLIPNILEAEEMQKLGIDSMNDFAEAILNNSKGQGYNKVTGWTMDDVVAVYVGEKQTENIEYKGGYSVLVVTKDDILKIGVGTQRYSGSTDDVYGMLLLDNPNVSIVSVESIADYSNNAVTYNENGNRNLDQNIQATMYLGSEIIGFYDTKRNRTRLI